MQTFDYTAYETLFNTGDDAALVAQFFHDDCVFASGSRTVEGKAALLAFLQWAHNGVREVMRPQQVLQQGDTVFAEVDMDFHATRERPDFPFGALCPGDQLTVKFFVTYHLRDGRIDQLKAMHWPPECGVSHLPRLGPHPGQLAAFHAYLAAFSHADFQRFTAFYTEDVCLALGSVPTITGKQGIIDFYTPMFARIRESLTVNTLQASETAIQLDAITLFTALEAAPDFVVGPLRKGESYTGRILVTYQLRDGLICHIGVTRGGDMVLEPAPPSA